MALEHPGVAPGCRTCHGAVPARAKFCTRCGSAQGPDPLTRTYRRADRAARHFSRRYPLFGAEPVLWLFAGLGGLAISVMRNFDRLFSAYAFGYAIGGTIFLVACGAVAARVAWYVSRRSQSTSLLAGLAVIFFVAIIVVVRGAAPPPAAAAASARPPDPPRAAVPNTPAPRTPAFVPPGPRIVEPPTVVRSAVPPPIRNFPVLTPPAVEQLILRWQSSGDRVECTITNGSAWHVQELWVLVNVYQNQRVTDGRSCHVVVSIPPGKTERVELPLDFGFKPGYGLACRVISAGGLEPTSPQARIR